MAATNRELPMTEALTQALAAWTILAFCDAAARAAVSASPPPGPADAPMRRRRPEGDAPTG